MLLKILRINNGSFSKALSHKHSACWMYREISMKPAIMSKLVILHMAYWMEGWIYSPFGKSLMPNTIHFLAYNIHSK